MAYRTFIGANINGNTVYFDLDTCTERSVSSNAVIPQYPVESGVTISDHMYRNPRTLTLSGSFSLNRGADDKQEMYTLTSIMQDWPQDARQAWLDTEGAELKSLNANDRLSAVQTVFEWIQANGVLCDIYMQDKSSTNAATRFKSRKNMALQNISWRENYNSMQYTFTFTEIINISALSSFETYTYKGDYADINLPAARSLGEVLADTGGLINLVIETLVERGYISKADAKALVLNADVTKAGELQSFARSILEIMASRFFGAAKGALIGAAVAAAGGLVTAKLAAAGILSSAGPVGWVILGAAVLGAVIGEGIAIYNRAQAEARLNKGFNLVKNYRQYVDPKTLEPVSTANDAVLNTPDFSRLRLLLDDIAAGVNEVFTSISLYQLSTSNEPLTNCKMPLQVGSDILTVTVTPANATDSATAPYQMSIERGTGEAATNVTPLFGRWPVVPTLADMKPNGNMVYRDTSRQYQMYLMNPAIAYTNNDVELKAAYEAGSNYYLVVCRGNIEDAVKKLQEKIIEILSNQGYTE